MPSIKLPVLFFSLFGSVLSFTPCPLHGPAYPPFTLNTEDSEVANALDILTENFTQLVKSGTGPNGDVSPNTTFSIALFSSNKGDSEEKPFFWEYHHTSSALQKTSRNTHGADKDSVYGIGGLTEVFTLWALLLTEGEDYIFSDPVTKHLPELRNPDLKAQFQKDPIGLTNWEDVTVGQLASHMSGIARDYCYKNLTLQTPSHKAGLPPHSPAQQPCCAGNSQCTSDEFIQHLASRAPVAPAGMTPSYSNMAFQLLGYILEKRTGKSFEDAVQSLILDKLDMSKTSVYAPKNASAGVIPVSKKASGWSNRSASRKSSTSMFSSAKDLAIAGKAILNSTLLSHAQTRRWLKPVSHTSNPANSLGAPWVIYSNGDYPKTPVVDVYTVLSNEGSDDEGLYSSYLGLVPDYGVGYAILSADTKSPADLNAHADYIQVVLEAVLKTAVTQAAKNYVGAYKATGPLKSSIVVNYDRLPGLYIQEFISNGTDFRETLAQLTDVKKVADLSIRLDPTQVLEKSGAGSKQAFRAVFQDKTELADNETPTCVSWLDLDKFQYNGRGLDEFIFTLDKAGKAVGVEIPALEAALKRSK